MLKHWMKKEVSVYGLFEEKMMSIQQKGRREKVVKHNFSNFTLIFTKLHYNSLYKFGCQFLLLPLVIDI